MRCRICGRECPPAAKICRDCASARKRAFAATVTQPLLAAVGAPSVGEPRFVPRRTRRRSQRAASDSSVVRALASPPQNAALPLTVVPRKRGLIGFVVAAVILVAGLIAVMRTASEGSHVTDEVEPKPPLVTAVEPAAPPTPSAPPVIVSTPLDEPAGEQISPKTMTPKPAKKSLPRSEPAMPAAVEPAPPAPAPVASAPVPQRVVEAPRQDPWQSLNEGLARCAREGILDRMSCEQRLRAQYCGNSWGLVPQCPIGPATDHGQ